MSEQEFITPSATDIELLVIGAILSDSAGLEKILNILTPEMFFNPINKSVFETIVKHDSIGDGFDIFSISQELKTELEPHGGLLYLLDASERISSSARIREHALIVREKFILRKMTTKFRRVTARIGAGDDTNEILSETNSMIDEINSLVSGVNGNMEHIAIITERALEAAAARQQAYERGESAAISTGLRGLDYKITGLSGSELILLAGRPGSGKTAMMLHLALSSAKKGIPVCIYSLEMSDISLANRLLLTLSGISSDRFRRGILDREDWIKLGRAEQELSKLPIYIDANAAVTMGYIRAHSKIMKKKGKCGVIMVDYLQLADMSTGRGSSNREQEVSEASRQAKLIAKELDVPVIVLSQLSRKVEERTDKIPIMSDLRESGGLEANADVILFMYRPEYYGITELNTSQYGTINTKGVGMISVAKQREGATGAVLFKYNENLSKFRDYEDSEFA